MGSEQCLPPHDEILAAVRERLSEKRMRHVLSVAEWAERIAGMAKVAAGRAVTAALLHDLCRRLDAEAMLEQAAACGIPIEAWHRQKPGLLHGPLAAEEGRRSFGVNDADVYEAIYWHTTGKAGLRRVGQVLYVADFCEPLRGYPEAGETRELLDRAGFEASLRFVARAKLRILSGNAVADPNTAAFCQWLDAKEPDGGGGEK